MRRCFLLILVLLLTIVQAISAAQTREVSRSAPKKGGCQSNPLTLGTAPLKISARSHAKKIDDRVRVDRQRILHVVSGCGRNKPALRLWINGAPYGDDPSLCFFVDSALLKKRGEA